MLKKYTLFTLSALLLSNLYIAPANAIDSSKALNSLKSSVQILACVTATGAAAFYAIIAYYNAKGLIPVINSEYISRNDKKRALIYIAIGTHGFIEFSKIAYFFGKCATNNLKSLFKN